MLSFTRPNSGWYTEGEWVHEDYWRDHGQRQVVVGYSGSLVSTDGTFTLEEIEQIIAKMKEVQNA